MISLNKLFLRGCILMMLPACTIAPVPSTSVHQPLQARPAPVMPAQPGNGAIFHAGLADRPLFEDRRARQVGDTLTITISESTAASKKSNTNTGRNSGNAFGVSALQGLPGKSFLGANLNATSAFSFDGKGESASNNDFTGTITVTVIEVYANGNLLVSGEKQIGINQGSEFVRLSGVVNPANLNSSNTVSSVQLADARVEYRSNGVLSDAQTSGWLSRFFQNVLPF